MKSINPEQLKETITRCDCLPKYCKMLFLQKIESGEFSEFWLDEIDRHITRLSGYVRP